MAAPEPPASEKTDRQEPLNERAVQIAEIVDKERRRRRRTLRTLLLLLLVTLALAVGVLRFGRTEGEVIKTTVQTTTAETLQRQVPPLVEQRMAEQAQPILNNAVREQLPAVVDTRLGTMVKDAVDDEIEERDLGDGAEGLGDKINTFEEQLGDFTALIKKLPTPKSPFTDREATNIKDALLLVPDLMQTTERLSGQMDELAATSNASTGSSWREDEPEIREKLTNLERDMEANRRAVADVSRTMASILERLDAGRGQDPCAGARAALAGPFLTYSVKENSKAEIYDLGLQVSIGGQDDGTLHDLAVRAGGKKIYGAADVKMGDLITFEDDTHQYSLIPIFINRRRLAKDFIGFAISRARKCPKTAP